MKALVTIICALAIAPLAAVTAAPHLELGPMLGHVGSDVAHVWIKASAAGEASLLISERDDLGDATSHGPEKLEASHDFMCTLSAQPLVANQRY
ncbi:MAG: hypothetical protein ACR2RV_27790, partial [Verrucomicrobiales bacterium]